VHEAVVDAWRYAGLEARQLGRVSARDVLVGVLLRPPAKLAYNVLYLGAWRDGTRGFMKLALECAGDAFVWLRSLRGGRAADAKGSGHFGHRFERRGPVRVIVVAERAGEVDAVRGWLARAVAAGAWVALITSADVAVPGVDVYAVARVAPFALARALDWQAQLAPPDAIVPLGRRARRALALLPGTARMGAPALAPEDVSLSRA
jgi:hypothetical protein